MASRPIHTLLAASLAFALILGGSGCSAEKHLEAATRARDTAIHIQERVVDPLRNVIQQSNSYEDAIELALRILPEEWRLKAEGWLAQGLEARDVLQRLLEAATERTSLAIQTAELEIQKAQSLQTNTDRFWSLVNMGISILFPPAVVGLGVAEAGRRRARRDLQSLAKSTVLAEETNPLFSKGVVEAKPILKKVQTKGAQVAVRKAKVDLDLLEGR